MRSQVHGLFPSAGETPHAVVAARSQLGLLSTHRTFTVLRLKVMALLNRWRSRFDEADGIGAFAVERQQLRAPNGEVVQVDRRHWILGGALEAMAWALGSVRTSDFRP